MNWSCKLSLLQRERDGGGGQPPVKSEVRAQSNTVGRLRFFLGTQSRDVPVIEVSAQIADEREKKKKEIDRTQKTGTIILDRTF